MMLFFYLRDVFMKKIKIKKIQVFVIYIFYCVYKGSIKYQKKSKRTVWTLLQMQQPAGSVQSVKKTERL